MLTSKSLVIDFFLDAIGRIRRLDGAALLAEGRIVVTVKAATEGLVTIADGDSVHIPAIMAWKAGFDRK
jgi:hypothetical protein